jgi:hypothetical protein
MLIICQQIIPDTLASLLFNVSATGFRDSCHNGSWDGTRNPQGQKGDQILLAAYISPVFDS